MGQDMGVSSHQAPKMQVRLGQLCIVMCRGVILHLHQLSIAVVVAIILQLIYGHHVGFSSQEVFRVDLPLLAFA